MFSVWRQEHMTLSIVPNFSTSSSLPCCLITSKLQTPLSWAFDIQSPTIPPRLSRCTLTNWHQPMHIDKLTSADAHWQTDISRCTLTNWHQPMHIDKLTSADAHCQTDISRCTLTNWHQPMHIDILTSADTHWETENMNKTIDDTIDGDFLTWIK